MNITFNTKKKKLSELKQLLHFLSDSYQPTLKSQVNIDVYAIKLNDLANFIFINDNLKTIGLLAYYISGEESFITSIGIHKNYHGKKLGQILFDYYIDIIIQKKIQKIKLHVHHKNTKAQSFYLKNDFKFENNKNSFIGTKYIK